MKPQYSVLVFLIILLSSCDYARDHLEEGKSKIQSKTRSFAIESTDLFLELPDRSVQRKVSKNELYGSWSVSNSSVSRMEYFESENPDWDGIPFPAMLFTLQKANHITGVFNAKYIRKEDKDDFFLLSDYKDTLTLVGQWDLEADTMFHYKIVAQFDFPKNHTYFYSFNLAEEDSSLVLWNYIGDPDDVKYQDYKKD
jgi:hypothetical protein